jgi:hypothetical protein
MSPSQLATKPKKAHADPKSHLYVPNDSDNRKGINPAAAKVPCRPYSINYEALQLADILGARPCMDTLETLLFLEQKIQDPRFHLEMTCRSCQTWVPTRLTKPARRGAVDNLQGCQGCAYSFLDGVDGDFADSNRNAAHGAWAGSKRDVADLELRRSQSTGTVEKERLTKQLERAYGRLRKALNRCQRLGFRPGVPHRAPDTWVRPLMAQTRDARRKAAELDRREAAPSPKCANCWNWTEEDALSGGAGTFGRCGAKDGEVTKGNFWCREHSHTVG